MAATTLIVIYSPLGILFEFVKLPLVFLGLILGILACYFLLVEGLKHIIFRRYETKRAL